MSLESLKEIKEELIDSFLEQNCKVQYESIQYGMQWIQTDVGYSARDQIKAEEYAKEKMEEEFKKIFNQIQSD